MASIERMKGKGPRAPAAAFFASAALSCCMMTPAHAGDAASWQPIAVRLGVEPGATRLVLDLPAPPGVVRLSSSAELSTLTFTQPQGAEPGEGAGRGLVRRWRIEARGAEVRVSVDLAPGSAVRRRFAIAPQTLGAPWRYVVDIAGTTAAAPPVILAAARPTQPAVLRVVMGPAPIALRPAALQRLAQMDPGPLDQAVPQLSTGRVDARRSGPTVLASAPPRQTERARPIAFRERKTVVIDAGHGGHDVGARGGSSDEKDLNLAAALALKARLERTGRYRVVLTRDDDTYVPLDQRVRIARRSHADLFISLHSDSAGLDASPHGASVYTLSDSGVNRVRTVLAPDDALSRAGGPRAGKGVSQILIDLSQRSTRNHSAEFAGLLLNHIGHTVELLPRSHRDAGYFVLLAPDVPAVLLEMGFVTNAEDEARLASREQRRAFMERVGDAIDDYFAPPRQVAAATS